MVAAPEEGRSDDTRPMKVLRPGSQISHYRIIEKLGQGGIIGSCFFGYEAV